MPKQENDVVNDIVCYIRKTQTPLDEWYVGIAKDAKVRLFEDHRVNKNMDYWIYRKCLSNDAACRVKQCLITKYQMDGGLNSAGYALRFVYAYKKERHTKEE